MLVPAQSKEYNLGNEAWSTTERAAATRYRSLADVPLPTREGDRREPERAFAVLQQEARPVPSRDRCPRGCVGPRTETPKVEGVVKHGQCFQ